MTKALSLSAEYESERSPPTSLSNWEQLGRSTVSRRVDRLSLLRRNTRLPVQSVPQHLDADLLRELQNLDDTWSRELSALIEMKRERTPETVATAEISRAATARVVARIEAAKAMTFDGLKVKTRAALWRRHGEPLPPGGFRPFAFGGAGAESSALCEA
jgi:hypothetical protein